MITLKALFDCEPQQFVRLENYSQEAPPFFQRFCDEQPMVIVFLTKYGVHFGEHQTWTALSTRCAQRLWWNYLGNEVSLPQVTQASLERHYQANKEFVETTGAAARAVGIGRLREVLLTRPQPTLRLLVIAGLYDKTQRRIIGPKDKEEAPDLVSDQDHMHALLGAVLEAFEEAAQSCASNDEQSK